MAIVQISRIQHRRGVKTDLPQLASAELGWSVDSRQLYIGNGTLEEGAPSVGNTEILTEYSDLLSVAETYTFNGNAAGYSVQTGTSSTSPITRTLQQKLDDFVNVRDFGAKGDGTTNDTAAINRALQQLYTRNETYTTAPSLARRSLYFPAGNYILSGNVMRIPPYTTIVGDGMEHTIITQTDGTQECVAKLVDSKNQEGSSIGLNGAVIPSYININGVTFDSAVEVLSPPRQVFRIDQGNLVFFRNVRFTGNTSDLTASTSGSACIKFSGSTEVTFDNCEFDNQPYAVIAAESNISNIVFSGSKFHNLYLAMNIGDIGTEQVAGNIRVFNSTFDNIYSSAIESRNANNIISSFNYYGSVGYNNTAEPREPVISFAGKDCYSFGDTFLRTDDGKIETEFNPVLVVIPQTGIRIGERNFGPGTRNPTLTNGTNTMLVAFPAATNNAQIKYIATRGDYSKFGTMEITQSNGVLTYVDSYSETGTVDVTMSANISNSSPTVWATIGSNGGTATLKYAIDTIIS